MAKNNFLHQCVCGGGGAGISSWSLALFLLLTISLSNYPCQFIPAHQLATTPPIHLSTNGLYKDLSTDFDKNGDECLKEYGECSERFFALLPMLAFMKLRLTGTRKRVWLRLRINVLSVVIIAWNWVQEVEKKAVNDGFECGCRNQNFVKIYVFKSLIFLFVRHLELRVF